MGGGRILQQTPTPAHDATLRGVFGLTHGNNHSKAMMHDLNVGTSVERLRGA